jgi:hypothetical protein
VAVPFAASHLIVPRIVHLLTVLQAASQYTETHTASQVSKNEMATRHVGIPCMDHTFRLSACNAIPTNF